MEVLTITEENVTIIGGNPTIGNEVDSGKIRFSWKRN